jgi:hypothetical protein
LANMHQYPQYLGLINRHKLRKHSLQKTHVFLTGLF